LRNAVSRFKRARRFSRQKEAQKQKRPEGFFRAHFLTGKSIPQPSTFSRSKFQRRKTKNPNRTFATLESILDVSLHLFFSSEHAPSVGLKKLPDIRLDS